MLVLAGLFTAVNAHRDGLPPGLNAAVTLAPIYEEALFRGGVSQWLESRAVRQGRSTVGARRLSDAIFAGAHFLPRVGRPLKLLPTAPFLMMAGADFGKHLNRVGMVQAMAMHGLHNALLLPGAFGDVRPWMTFVHFIGLPVALRGFIEGIRVSLEESRIQRIIGQLKQGFLSDPLVTPASLESWCIQLLEARNCRGFDFAAGVEMAYRFAKLCSRLPSEPERVREARILTLEWVRSSTPPERSPMERAGVARELLERMEG